MIPSWVYFDVYLAGAIALALLFLVPNPLRDSVLRLYRILRKRTEKAITTPIDRELALIAGPQRTIDEALQKVEDLRGSLQHENDVLLQRQDDLTDAEDEYYKASEEQSAEGAKSPEALDDLVAIVAEKEEAVSLQQRLVDGMKSAVETAVVSVQKARRELRRLQMTVKSDEAKDRATAAINNAAKVIDAARALGAAGGALQEESDSVNEAFEKARARMEDLDGSTPADNEFRERKTRQDMDAIRRRLEARRAQTKAQ